MLSSTVFAVTPVELADPTIDTIRPRIDFFASASTPFGMVALHPDTNPAGQLWNTGYRWGDQRIFFFTHSHMVQTPGIPIMPVVGPVTTNNSSAFSHEQETIRPGYHQVKLLDSGINAEMTASCRVGLSRYTFPACDEAHILFELYARLADVNMKKAFAEQRSPTRVVGYSELSPTGRRKKPSAIYFAADFSKPFDSFVAPDVTYRKLKANEQVLVKVGISYVSIEGAIRNLETEMPGWDFEATRAAATKAWNDYLGRIEITGGTRAQQVKFYTDLMHTAIGRRIYSDVDGAYMDRGGKEPVVRKIPLDADGKPKWQAIDMDCLWGTQWNLNILWTLAYPVYGNWVAQTLLQYYRNNGILGRGQWGGDENFTMVGDTATPLLAALANNGRARFDLAEAYAAARKNAFPDGVRDHYGYDVIGSSYGMECFGKLGYVPAEIGKHSAGYHRGSAGLTLEYAYQDWCLAQLAKQLGKSQDAELFLKRSENWRNVFDTSVGWARPRHEDGKWVEPFSPIGKWNGFNEATPAIMSYYVPQNVSGLIAAMGGRDAFVAKLDKCFEESKTNRFIDVHGYVDYSNQPSCSMANLFSYAGAPWKSQYWLRQVKELTFGGTTPQSGYNGDEDEGQMGALGVLMAIGLFNVQGCVGTEPQVEITSPLFDRIVLHTSDKTFEVSVRRQDPAKDIYIQSVKLNGKAWNSFRFSVSALLKGGHMEIQLGPVPNQKWGTDVQ
jgi:predicted alpha-1,2-mannosidase